ncbi:OLC1v1012682C1 [Oldenlandia corymbosa var. corymbosa]|uniref:OLC1v1012682C1 n=1 Tax=Oldenlandia corymbosa var. corymbosa TaxID=529605 RepID=A0AAV1DYD8_OLDCO|nr:OLC1v1012682C1 [Oldenlandia corymbosa var. corymbosa]
MVRDFEGKTIEDFASSIDSVDKVENIRTRCDLPLDLEDKALLRNKRANSLPEGRITVYDRFIHLGLRLPLFPLFEEIVQHYKTPLARFTPNLITFVLGFMKRRLRSGIKKMVEASGGSSEWKPDFLFVRAPKNYCLLWNHQETEGLGVIKDDWTQEDDDCIEELDADMKKILEYSKMRMYLSPHPSKKKKGIVKTCDKVKSKKARTDAPPKETMAPVEEIVPLATETLKNPPPETRPSFVPPGSEKGKGLLKGEAIILPPQLFEGGPSVAVHTFSNPPSIECPVLKEFAAQLNKADNLRLMKSFASLHISKEELHQWCAAFMYKMLSIGGMAAALEEMTLVATKCGAHRVGVAGLKRLDQDRPINAKWFKQVLMKDPKKTMHEAIVKVLTKLSLEQLPLWEALTGALAKMSSPADIASFPCDVPTILARGPSEEDSTPDVPDEYMDIELEDADKDTEEDVVDTDHSGALRNAEDASQNPSKDPSSWQ